MKFIPRKLYAKIEKKLFDRFWENELLNFLKLKLFFFKFKIENFTKIKKTSSYIHPRNIHTDFEKNPNIGCWVTDVDRRTDRPTFRPTDRPTDRRRATAIGPVDLKIKYQISHLLKNQISDIIHGYPFTRPQSRNREYFSPFGEINVIKEKCDENNINIFNRGALTIPATRKCI